jgi:hypothetical protein
VKVKLHQFLTFALDGDKSSASCTDHFTSWNRVPCTCWTGGWICPGAHLDLCLWTAALPSSPQPDSIPSALLWRILGGYVTKEAREDRETVSTVDVAFLTSHTERRVKLLLACRIWGSHSQAYEQCCLLGWKFGTAQHFRGTYRLRLPGQRVGRARNQFRLLFDQRYVPPKWRALSALHAITAQNIGLFRLAVPCICCLREKLRAQLPANSCGMLPFHH